VVLGITLDARNMHKAAKCWWMNSTVVPQNGEGVCELPRHWTLGQAAAILSISRRCQAANFRWANFVKGGTFTVSCFVPTWPGERKKPEMPMELAENNAQVSCCW